MKRSSLKKPILFFVTAGLVITVFLFSTMQSCKKDTTTTQTFYDTLGGTTMVQDPTAATGTMIEMGRLGIRGVVDSALFIIAADTQLQKYFVVLLSELHANNLTGFSALSKNLTDFFCVATGAKDYTYSGLSMTAAHNPATNPRMTGKVDAADFNQFVNDLVASANKNHLNSYDIGRLGAIVGTVQSQVVQM